MYTQERKDCEEGMMFKYKWLILLILYLVPVQPTLADDGTKIIGLWRLVSFELEFQSGEREQVLGKNPVGYAMNTPEGRVWVVFTGEGREAAKTDQERADLFKSLIAFTGTYRIEGDKLIFKPDVCWNPAWIGTEQVRHFRFEGDDRFIETTDWQQSVLRPERGKMRATYVLERVK
jgi:hypothetical protein